MTREELIDCINDDINPRTCPEYSCNMPEEENNVGKCCRECAEKQLEDYEEKIRADERAKIKDEFKIYNRLEAKFTLSQCSEKDGLYCLDVTELFYGLVDRVLGGNK